MTDNEDKNVWEQTIGRGLGYRVFNARSQVRLHESAFYEKVALLDGGTVALVVSAAIDKLHGQIRHPFALKLGLVCLTVAMLSLFARNFFWTQYESQVVEMKLTNATLFRSLGEIEKSARPERIFGFFGLLLTVVGMFMLLYVAASLS